MASQNGGEKSGWSVLLAIGVILFFTYVIYTNRNRSQESLYLANKSQAEIQILLNRIEQLERPSTTIDTTQQALASVNPRVIQNGLYQISTKVSTPIKGSNARTEKNYTIYHIKTDLSTDSSQPRPFQVGIASSSYLQAPTIYVDFDSDGAVDLQPMHEIIKWLPFHQLFSGTINQNFSQEVYATFLLHSSEAKFTPSQAIAEHGNYMVRGLWQVISDKSAEIIRWGSPESGGETF